MKAARKIKLIVTDELGTVLDEQELKATHRYLSIYFSPIKEPLLHDAVLDLEAKKAEK